MPSQSSNTATRPSDSRPACPVCRSDVFVDMANSNAHDFRCQLCDHRFDAAESPRWYE